MSEMKNPTSTYRIQLSGNFTFKHLRQIIPYLHDLGISTVYASPVFQARESSTHGYDVVDPTRVNSEIGTLEEWREISRELKQRNMSWLQDIVPNHMAFASSNLWLMDVFEFGPGSEYYHTFDIDWEYPDPQFTGKVMAPFLGDEATKVISGGELKIDANEHGLSLGYFEHQYPLSARSYPLILKEVFSGIEEPPLQEKLQQFIQQDSTAVKEWQRQKEALWPLLKKDGAATILEEAVENINASPAKLSEILEQQYFRFVHWQATESRINYRRFFTINDLICLRMEDQKVFDQYHAFIVSLCEEGLIDGLRIDHIDGLFDPQDYLEKLNKLVGEDRYTIIEKILEWNEDLPLHWPMHGTSGYGFLATVSQLFTRPESESDFTNAYSGITTNLTGYHDLVYEKKKFILEKRMGGELQNLYRIMEQRELLPEKNESSKARWLEALSAFLSAFPVYRIYFREFPIIPHERELLEYAYEIALDKQPTLREELSHLLILFVGEHAKSEDEQYFVQRCQQFTGPLAAKGVEDTSFYIYNRLISHNEVGDTPANFGISTKDFHERMLYRKDHFPFSINTTATHDTKRGEDARMRINALSEHPDEWFGLVEQWNQANAPLKRKKNVPDDNEEYFIYQALIGAWPVDNRVNEEFIQRTLDYLQKVLREAKVHSNWSQPDERYEETVYAFIRAILKNEDFRNSFDPFVEKMTLYGAIYSLGQCVLKASAPGVPDVYQGTELWDLSYVDPDNRRPVDYALRSQYLGSFLSDMVLPAGMLKNFRNGKLKMYVLQRTLQLRRDFNEIFDEGEYLPVTVSPEYKEQVVAYIRRRNDKWVMVAVPCQVASLAYNDGFPIGEPYWKNAFLSLPDGAPSQWKSIYTGEETKGDHQLLLKDVFAHLPVGILTNFADEI